MESFSFNSKFKLGDKVSVSGEKVSILGEKGPYTISEIDCKLVAGRVPILLYGLAEQFGLYTANQLELYKEDPEFVWVRGYYVVPESNRAEMAAVSCKLFYSHQEAEKFAKGKGFKKFRIRSHYVRTDKETSGIFKRVDFMYEKDLVK